MKRIGLVLGMALLLISLGAPSHAGFGIKGDLKIAYIMGSTVKDGGWGESHGIAIEAIEKEFGVKVAVTENVAEDTVRVKQIIDLYVRRGHNIIIGNSFGFSDAFLEAANQYPEVAFMNAAGVTNNQRNLESFYLRTYQGWYLAGIIAGSKTKANKMGMIAGFPLGLVNWDINAFMRGAQSVNPDVELSAVFLNTWYDSVKEGQASEALLEQNVDVVATDLSAASALNAAEQLGRYSVGFQIDMTPHAPKGHLTSVLLVWAPYLTGTIKKIQAGEWEPSEWGAFVGMETGSVALGGITKDIPEDVLAKVEAAKQAIIDGKLTPFDGPLNNQKGEQVLSEGNSLDDGDLWKMNYFVQGIVGTMPESN